MFGHGPDKFNPIKLGLVGHGHDVLDILCLQIRGSYSSCVDGRVVPEDDNSIWIRSPPYPLDEVNDVFGLEESMAVEEVDERPSLIDGTDDYLSLVIA